MEDIRDFTTNLAFQEAFRAYFSEIGIHLKPDTGVWEEIAASAEREGTLCRAVYRDGVIAAFILFQTDALQSGAGFFVRRVGFIRELWVRPEYRGQGLGRALVDCAEEQFRIDGAAEIILTYDPDAAGFYRKLGFAEDSAYSAKNKMAVMARPVRKEVSGSGKV